MRPTHTVYLVELRDGGRPVGLYLHVWDDARSGDSELVWSRDTAHALRFSSKPLADEHIRDELDHDAVAVAVNPADIPDVPDGRDCGCTIGFVCRHNTACPRATSRRQAEQE